MRQPMLAVPTELPLSTVQLSAEHIAVLRTMLEEQRAFRIDQLTQLHRPEPTGPLSSTDPEIFRSLDTGARAALHDVQAALWRMDEGTYGACVQCNDPIPAERLEILPQTALCLACQRPARG
jgi:RNA polymerase-binding transcription factor